MKKESKVKLVPKKDLKAHKDNTFCDNSVIMSFSMDNLTEKDVNKVIDTFDKIQKDFRKNISNYYIKTSSNTTKQKGRRDILDV